MDYTIAVVMLLIGSFFGWIISKRWYGTRSGVSKEIYEPLLKQEAIAQEKVRGLTEEVKSKSEEISRLRDDNAGLNKEITQLQVKLPQLQQSLNELKIDRDSLKNLVDETASRFTSAQLEIASLQTEKQHLCEQIQTLKDSFEVGIKQSKLTFENIANQILEAKTKSFSETTEKSLDGILKPLKDKILTFEKAVDEKYSTEAKERHVLKSEIGRLIALNETMTKETTSLTQALRGDSKVQGDWGELVLERILEASGLRAGQEYSQQKSLNDDDGDRYRPDVIINLPDGKHIIVDSKVSLKAYDSYRSSSDNVSQEKALHDHIKSIERHIEELSSKPYARLKGMDSPELTIIFIPIEPAYLLAMQKDPDLVAKAWKKSIAIVTATNLFACLKTVASLWNLEKQNKNALEIADEGAKLYDKFVGFLADFEEMGKTFEKGTTQFSTAMGKLRDGKGNIFTKIERMRELGASPKNKIPPKYLDNPHDNS